MKRFLITLFIPLLVGCTGLDLEPKNGLTPSLAFSDFDGYQSYIAKIYASLTLTGQQGPDGQGDLSIINDEGFSSYLRVWWKAQELTTDEAIIAWNDSGIRDLHNHEWGANNQFVRVLYYRIFFTVSLANDFIRVAQDLPEGLSADEIAEIDRFVAEARFIRAFAYWHALDHFRNVALITSITSSLPSQVSPQQIFEFIESELNAIEDQMLPPGQGNHAYGRLDRAAAWMLKAKLYLNAEVYYGVNRYADVITEVNKVINSAQYNLAANYQEIFMGDNHLRTDEIIWPLVHDGVVSRTWGGTTTIIRGAIGGAMSDDKSQGTTVTPANEEALDAYGVPGGWAGYRTTKSLVNLFDELVFADNLNENANKWTLPTNNSWSYSSTDGNLSYTPNAGTYASDGIAIQPTWEANRDVRVTFSVSYKNASDATVEQAPAPPLKSLSGRIAIGNATTETQGFNINGSGTFSFIFNTASDDQIRFYGATSADYATMEIDVVNINYVDGDGRFLFYTEGQSLEIEEIGQFEDGFAIPKFTNIESSTGDRAPGVDQVGTDYPVFRLAEAYLMLAEAEVRVNGSASTTTVGYLNELRQRAYGDNSGDVVSGDVTLNWILDERARELYLEATRRTDLVRFGRFSGGDYLWPWKGGVAEGTTTPAYLDIFPIPSSDLIANPNLVQNDGY